jgi:hypothetical protein
MFLSGVLFVLFLAGFWLYCLTDAALTPAWEYPGMRKQFWLVLIFMAPVIGGIAWFAGRYVTRRRRMADRFMIADALARHPATRARLADPFYRPRPVGPDDDADFLRQLAARIREGN